MKVTLKAALMHIRKGDDTLHVPFKCDFTTVFTETHAHTEEGREGGASLIPRTKFVPWQWWSRPTTHLKVENSNEKSHFPSNQSLYTSG